MYVNALQIKGPRNSLQKRNNFPLEEKHVLTVGSIFQQPNSSPYPLCADRLHHESQLTQSHQAVDASVGPWERIRNLLEVSFQWSKTWEFPWMMIIAHILGSIIHENSLKSSTELGLSKSKLLTCGVEAEITWTPSHAVPDIQDWVPQTRRWLRGPNSSLISYQICTLDVWRLLQSAKKGLPTMFLSVLLYMIIFLRIAPHILNILGPLRANQKELCAPTAALLQTSLSINQAS